MPCMTYDDQEVIGQQSDRIDELTRFLCTAIKLLRKNQIHFTGSLAAWARRHDAEDARRIADEREVNKDKAIRKTALSKLTREEKRALGVR